MYEVSDGGRGADLALVDAGVLALRIFDAQLPVLGVRRVERLEALVARVRVASHGEQVDVPMAHPRHRAVAQVLDAAVEVRHLTHQRRHVVWNAQVKVRTGAWRRHVVQELRPESARTPHVATCKQFLLKRLKRHSIFVSSTENC